MLLDIRNVGKTFRGRHQDVCALDEVSLSVDAGQFVGVQGPSGCGKTTLLLIAGGLLSPDGGEVVVDGQNPYQLSPDARAKFRADHIGFVFQQFHLVPYLSVLDNVLAASIATNLADADSRARELIAHFSLEHRLHHVPSRLSTGERQRTALARALLNRPKVLLADEPTGNLDRESADVVLKHLAEFAREGAVLLVAHDTHALEFAHRVAQIRDGKLTVDS
jgi:ABC-type lipoprotein export system ATPase subunit